MRLDKRLNLIIPIAAEDGSTVKAFIHSTPLSRDVFEQYFLVISKAFAMIYNEGLSATAGPPVAALMLKKVAQDRDAWDGDGGVKTGLMAEIRRLSNVVIAGDQGWNMVPLQVAVDQGLLDPDDIAEAEGSIVFFILASAVHHRRDANGILQLASRLWNSRVESSSLTEFIASLPILTQDESTGETAKRSSIPS